MCCCSLRRLQPAQDASTILVRKESPVSSVKDWLNRNIVRPLVALLRQGVPPERLALCVAIGVVVGNIPILGMSTILCAVIALAFRLNLPAIQIVQAAHGADASSCSSFPSCASANGSCARLPNRLSVEDGVAILSHGVGRAIVVLRDAILHAGFAWLLVAPLAVLLFQRLLTPTFERTAARIKQIP